MKTRFLKKWLVITSIHLCIMAFLFLLGYLAPNHSPAPRPVADILLLIVLPLYLPALAIMLIGSAFYPIDDIPAIAAVLIFILNSFLFALMVWAPVYLMRRSRENSADVKK